MKESIRDNKLVLVTIVLVGIAVAGFGATQTDAISSISGELSDHSGDAMQAEGDAMEAEGDAMESEGDAMESDNLSDNSTEK